MIADDFTEAARAYAEEWNRHAEESFNRGQEGAHGVDEESLIIGAEWARDHLFEQMKQKVAAAHQERNKALERARKAEELLRNVGDHLATQEPTDAEREARWVVEHKHQFHGSQCLCGFETDRARTRTEHILTHYFDEVRTARAARRDKEKR